MNNIVLIISSIILLINVIMYASIYNTPVNAFNVVKITPIDSDSNDCMFQIQSTNNSDFFINLKDNCNKHKINDIVSIK